eukprot:TRINITY_DN10451_c1_g2_i1.p2 TRINITY_DN10451_c1_g2~~TRINITY_DN10451_c1_g2_i1.p2  ORF type:complete len:142 (+),score=8.93 TRINITY_DN10451_c1_g2_i1:124-549(+)
MIFPPTKRNFILKNDWIRKNSEGENIKFPKTKREPVKPSHSEQRPDPTQTQTQPITRSSEPRAPGKGSSAPSGCSRHVATLEEAPSVACLGYHSKWPQRNPTADISPPSRCPSAIIPQPHRNPVSPPQRSSSCAAKALPCR